jgi:hypothetical protein
VDIDDFDLLQMLMLSWTCMTVLASKESWQQHQQYDGKEHFEDTRGIKIIPGKGVSCIELYRLEQKASSMV